MIRKPPANKRFTHFGMVETLDDPRLDATRQMKLRRNPTSTVWVDELGRRFDATTGKRKAAFGYRTHRLHLSTIVWIDDPRALNNGE